MRRDWFHNLAPPNSLNRDESICLPRFSLLTGLFLLFQALLMGLFLPEEAFLAQFLSTLLPGRFGSRQLLHELPLSCFQGFIAANRDQERQGDCGKEEGSNALEDGVQGRFLESNCQTESDDERDYGDNDGAGEPFAW
jgi:hypothetical protein